MLKEIMRSEYNELNQDINTRKSMKLFRCKILSVQIR